METMEELSKEEILAKQEAIGFADWVEKNYSYSFGTYEAIDPATKYAVRPQVEYSLEQLYNLYQQSKL